VKEAASFCKQKSWPVLKVRTSERRERWRYTAVATGSTRKLMRTGEILTPRDGDDARHGGQGRQKESEW